MTVALALTVTFCFVVLFLGGRPRGRISVSDARERSDLAFLALIPGLEHPSSELRLRRPRQRVKRVFDVTAATVLLVLTLPAVATALLAVKLTSRGPALYRQTRVGLFGRSFEILKIRTMVDGAERHTGPVLAARIDPRVTRVGAVLRRTRLDELPQLVNVLRGDMSLVGPRPERPEFVAEFERQHAAYQLRHLVRPGLTGLAQVRSTYASEVSEKLLHDLTYLRTASLVVDLRILAKTSTTVLDSQASAGLDKTDFEGPLVVGVHEHVGDVGPGRD